MESTAIKILLEDDYIIAVEKISGVPSHSLSDLQQITMESLLKKLKPELPELSPVHRLDTGTSGVLLFSKTLAVYDSMRAIFKNKQIRKYYQAWSRNSGWNHLLPFKITVPLAHHPKSKKRMIVITDEKKISHRGNPFPAETIIHSISEFEDSKQKLITQFDLEIITGVTHQIRVHLASVGFPLIGDPLYLKGFEQESLERLGLHSQKIEFNLYGKNYSVASKILCPYVKTANLSLV